MSDYQLARAFARLRQQYRALARAHQELVADMERARAEIREQWAMLARLHDLDAAIRADRDDDGMPLQ